MRPVAGLWLVVAAVLAGCGPDAPAADAWPGNDAPIDARIDAGAADAPVPTDRRTVILMIGDGMGRGQLEAASLYAHGATGQLFLESLAVRGELVTSSLSGTTDSAAASTTMATGARTTNGRVGLDRDGRAVQNLVELAHQQGRVAGVVTTAILPHATPAGFTAHRWSRSDYVNIADDQVLGSRAEVLLGGGSSYFLPAGTGSLRTDDGLLDELAGGGYPVIWTATELEAAAAAPPARLFGTFAAGNLEYVLRRPEGTSEPTLARMTTAALTVLDAHGTGFFLVVEGGRIDMACHGNLLPEAIAEVLAFDEAVEAAATWAAGRDDVTIVATADHETGGLAVVEPRPAGEYATVSWRWTGHTNAWVPLHASGPAVALFDGSVRDHTWLHAALAAALTGAPLEAPPAALVPDGLLGDLPHLAAVQINPSGFGAGYNQLDSLRLGVDAYSLAIGVEGLFEWWHNAPVLLIDADFGAATGPGGLHGALTDTTGTVDAILAGSSLAAPGIAGLGLDFAAVSFGGSDPHVEDLWDAAGLRGLHAPVGLPEDLAWLGAAMAFGEHARTRGSPSPPASPAAGEGWEVHIPWRKLYPDLAGFVPPGATIAIAVVLVNDDGGYTSNQALPPFGLGTANPGRVPTPFPAVVTYVIDEDLDGIPDGDSPPVLVGP